MNTFFTSIEVAFDEEPGPFANLGGVWPAVILNDTAQGFECGFFLINKTAPALYRQYIYAATKRRCNEKGISFK